MFPAHFYQHIQTPVFLLAQSVLDSWQLAHIWEDPNNLCITSLLATCAAEQIAVLSGYAADVLREIELASEHYTRSGSGGWIETCVEHVAAQGQAYFTLARGPSDFLHEALNAWWSSDGTYWHLPCTLASTTPHQCDPTCVGTSDYHSGITLTMNHTNYDSH
jgi:hypothetical protein